MLFTNKDLIRISGITRRTFYRRLKEFKEDKPIRKKGYQYNSEQAMLLASFIGFKDLLIKYMATEINKIELE